MTSSARTRIDGGTSRPSALAVLRFTVHATPPVCGRWLRRRYRRKIARRSLRSQEPEPDGRNENKPPRETGAALPRYGVTIARAKRSIAKPRRLSPSAPDVLKIELLTNP